MPQREASGSTFRPWLMEFTGNLFFAGAACPAVRMSTHSPRHPAGERLAVDPVGAARAQAFLSWLLAQVDLNARQYRLTSLARRLPACFRLLRVATIEGARERLDQHPELLSAAVDAVLLGVTQFYRDEAVFDTLQSRVLPELLSGEANIRVWSAACSEGPELYSVAMLLADAGRLKDAELLGTDCRPRAIARALAGIFPAEAAARMSPASRAKHLVPVANGCVQVAETLRLAMRWRRGNLLVEAAPGPWDLILCRNVAIYLDPDAARQLWRRLTDQLRLGGYLITGKAERPELAIGLERVASCVYQRTKVTHAN
jgi:chemotaxis protein methyltransferase CheR